jgi:type IV pilus assembly protein PilY1
MSHERVLKPSLGEIAALARSSVMCLRVALSVGVCLLTVGFAHAQDSTQVSQAFNATQLSAYPPNLKLIGGAPMMTLVSSRDHTLFAPIYTDFEDIDGDGVMDTTYKPDYRYYGYFDQDKCYRYNNTGARFEPVAYAQVASGTGVLGCAPVSNANNEEKPSYWLGNFLNWATMTRIDVIRKMLYGGSRVVDTVSDTTLQMAHMSQDAHSFVKYYGGADIGLFTPFSDGDLDSQGLTICNRGSVNAEGADKGGPRIRLAKGNFSLWATIPSKTVCRWSDEGDAYTFGAKTRAFYARYGTFANANQAHKTSLPGNGDKALAPVLDGSASAQLAVRVQACVKSDVLTPDKRCRAYLSSSGVSYKPTGILQDYGTSTNADLASRVEFAMLGGSYDWNMRGGALRKNMGSLNDEVDLTSGRFCFNFSSAEIKTMTLPANCKDNGGIIASFDKVRLYEIGDYNAKARDMDLLSKVETGVKFVLPDRLKNGAFPSWGNPMSEMLTQALYYLSNKDMGNASLFAGGAGRDIDKVLELPAVGRAIDPYADTTDSASGKSRKLMYGRGICRPSNVLAISSGSTNFDTDEGDSNTGAQSGSLYAGLRTMSGSSIADLTRRVGDNEKINGTSRSVGATDGTFGVIDGVLKAASCTVKAITGLDGVAGICPDAPGIKGTYLGAGAALFANTNLIRNKSELENAPTDLPPYAGRVKTYAASLAGGVARVEIPIGGRTVVITPESSWDHNLSQIMPGAMLTFKAIGKEVKAAGDGKPSTFRSSGSYVVTWNDTQFGGDYDMDMVGFLRWEVHQLDNGTYRLDVLTDVLAHDAGGRGSHGYSIVGVEPAEEARYLTHGSNDMLRAADSACNGLQESSLEYVLKCRFANGGMATTTGNRDTVARDGFEWPSSVTVDGQKYKVDFIREPGDVTPADQSSTTTRRSFVLSGKAGDGSQTTLRDPLWYIAKYGSFDTSETAFHASTNKLPDEPTATGSGANRNWDKIKNNGVTCSGGNCADGEPDGYFLARRPDLLEERLRNLFDGLNGSSNAAVAVSTSQLITSSLMFVASYEDKGNVRGGTVNAYQLGSDGYFSSTATWNAALKLGDEQAVRHVITNGPGAASPFASEGSPLTYEDVNALHKEGTDTTSTFVQALGSGADEASIKLAKNLIDYLRGQKLGLDGQIFLDRGNKKAMGTVVNSTPWLQDPSTTARYVDGDFPQIETPYSTFTLNRLNNNKVLWVGANEGLLHGFEASTGQPMLSYLPGPLVSSLSTALSFSRVDAIPLMDGSPFTGDVLLGEGTSARWRTYLFSSLGRGGKAVFALDVTDTGSLESATNPRGGLQEGNAGNIFKWTFTAADDADLGHNLSDPIVNPTSGQSGPIVRLNNGKFGVLVPNGYGSANGVGALFILYADGPVNGQWTRVSNTNPAGNYVKLSHLSTGSTESGNGYMGVTWADLNNDTTADVIYVTDLKGKVWKYDVRDVDPLKWGSAFKESGGTAKPFFAATSPSGQAAPITTAPVLTFPPFGGVMVSLGSGKSIENGDFPNWSDVQRFFSVWDAGGYDGDVVYPPEDKRDANGNAIPGRAMPTVGGMLEILLKRDGTSGSVYRYELKDGVETPVPQGSLAASFDPNGSKPDGWFFNFPSGGEQLIFSPQTRRSFITFSSVRPKSSSESESSCTDGPLGTFYGINPSSGQAVVGLLDTVATPEGVTGTSYGGQSTSQRVVSKADNTARTGGTELCKKPGSVCNPCAQCKPGYVGERLLGSDGNSSACHCLPSSSFRIQWREISGMRTQ